MRLILFLFTFISFAHAESYCEEEKKYYSKFLKISTSYEGEEDNKKYLNFSLRMDDKCSFPEKLIGTANLSDQNGNCIEPEGIKQKAKLLLLKPNKQHFKLINQYEIKYTSPTINNLKIIDATNNSEKEITIKLSKDEQGNCTLKSYLTYDKVTEEIKMISLTIKKASIISADVHVDQWGGNYEETVLSFIE